jgi:hypothetical protein
MNSEQMPPLLPMMLQTWEKHSLWPKSPPEAKKTKEDAGNLFS